MTVGADTGRRRFLTAAVSSVLVSSLKAEGLSLSLRGKDLLVNTPLQLITGPIFDRLKNGTTVPFDFHLSLWTVSRANLLRRAFERFVVSYDLWEERFSVTGLRNPRPAASNLSATGVAPWCLEHVALSPVEVNDDTQLWVRLDVRAADPKEASALVDETGLNLNYLIDLLSRPARKEPNRWTLETGPVRARDIRAVQPADARPR